MSAIKICGLFRDCDIDYVNEAGPDYIGFILNFPKSRRSISPERALELRSRLRTGIRSVGVFVDQPFDAVCEAVDLIGVNVIQLHGSEDDSYIAELRRRTAIPVWKAFKIREAEDLKEAKKCAADEVLLDNGYGTGAAFDWSLLGGFERPFILAGGLTPENIPEAVRMFSPKLLDISSGVETDSVKDKKKILAAVQAAQIHE